MTTARRFDVGVGFLRPVRRPDGTLLVECEPTREGILEYLRADGSVRRELVTLQAVLDTAKTAPRGVVTLGHPDEGFVDPDNFQELGVGDIGDDAFVGGVTRTDGAPLESDYETAQGGFARIKLAVRRRDALDAVDAGTHEVSLGYEVTLDETSGVHPVFGRFDARQVGRDVNHTAIVPKGRAGPTARLRMDSADAVQITQPTTHEVPMKTGLVALLTALGVQRFDDEDAALKEGQSAVSDLKAKADDTTELDKLKADLDAIEDKLEAMTGERDALKSKVDEMVKTESDRADAAQLAELTALAKQVGVKADGLDLPSLKLALAKSRVDSVDANTSAERLDGIISVVRLDVAKDAKRTDAAPDAYQFRADDGGADGGVHKRRDAYFDPEIEAWDAARGQGGEQ